MVCENAFACVVAVLALGVATLVRNTEASVILKTNNYSLDPFPDMPADFGPRIPNDGLEGLLVVADPEDACTPLINGPEQQPWVALIMRSQRVHVNCTFDIKVRNAEAAGAVAAIIYDDVYEALIIMSKPKDHEDPTIPALFVSQRSGFLMKRMMSPGTSTVYITPMSDAVWLSMLMSAFAGVLAVSVVIATFYFIRRHRLRAIPGRHGYSLLRNEEGMTAAQLRALPVVIFERPPSKRQRAVDTADWLADESSSDEDSASPIGRKGGGTLKTCAVCLEDYKDGEKLRVLPCKHRFHMECIDQWLSSRKPLCPICKHDSLKPLEDEEDAAGEPSATEEQGVPPPLPTQAPTPQRWRIWRRRQPSSALPVPLPSESSRDEPVADPQATPSNFPGMHFARQSPLGPNRGLAIRLSSEIVAEDDVEAGTGTGSLTQPLMECFEEEAGTPLGQAQAAPDTQDGSLHSVVTEAQ